MMKIDLEKLQQVEKAHASSSIVGDSLTLMIQSVLSYHDGPLSLAPNNVRIALDTLIDLGIIITSTETPPKKVEQLNS